MVISWEYHQYASISLMDVFMGYTWIYYISCNSINIKIVYPIFHRGILYSIVGFSVFHSNTTNFRPKKTEFPGRCCWQVMTYVPEPSIASRTVLKKPSKQGTFEKKDAKFTGKKYVITVIYT